MTELTVRVAPLDATVTVAVAKPALAAALASAVDGALRREVAAAGEEGSRRVVRLRTRTRLARLGGDRLAGALVMIRVTRGNARRLRELVEGARVSDAAGVQVIWDGIEPARSAVERHVFAALEAARATPAGPPVVLAKDAAPTFALRLLADRRMRVSRTENETR